jgi:hypothetical protein
MNAERAYVGLDLHKETIAVAVADTRHGREVRYLCVGRDSWESWRERVSRGRIDQVVAASLSRPQTPRSRRRWESAARYL